MRIHLEEKEIIDALKAHIEDVGISLSGMSVKVHLTAGRGSNGHTAQLEITKIKKEQAAEEEVETTVEEQPAILFGNDEEDL